MKNERDDLDLALKILTLLSPTSPSGASPSSPHATTHQSGGSDAIQLDALADPEDNTDLNASTSAHGLLTKLSNLTNQFLNGRGLWAQVGWTDISGKPTTFAPSAHAANHKSAGSDPIKLDELAAPTDVTTLNASTSAHGLLKKLSNVATQFMNGVGNWVAVGWADISGKPSTFAPSSHAASHLTGGGDDLPQWTFLTSPLTSTSWDGDARSTTAKTKIDLSTVFGVPANVKAILAHVAVRDSGSSGGQYYLVLSPVNTALVGPAYTVASRHANDEWTWTDQIVPCDANGDVYFQVVASGAATLDAILQIWGYLL